MSHLSSWPRRDDHYRNDCPVCGNMLIRDTEKAEQICPTCGYTTIAPADSSPEWKAIDLEDKIKKVRAGAPTTLALHDLGLTTEISPLLKDFHGRNVGPATRATFEKMKKWQNRIRTISSEERTLSMVLSRISEICSSLNLPDSIAETAAQIYRTSVKLKIAKSKSIMGMAAATVYLACRKCGISRTIKEIARAANMEKGNVARYYRLVLKEVEREYVPPPSVEKYISKLVNLAKIDPKVEHLALLLSRKTTDSRISSGKAPAGLAAAYVYLSAVMLGARIPQREIAEYAEVTEVTVRNRCREILENFTIRQELMSSE